MYLADLINKNQKLIVAVIVTITAILFLTVYLIPGRVKPLFPERVEPLVCPYDCPYCNGEISRDWGEVPEL